jgi:phage replication-related protein YjqB (UPF0714/DUF867 family)
VSPGDYDNYSDLKGQAEEGKDYRILIREGRTSIAVIAPHGGGIEIGTSELARAIAGDEHHLYCFEGIRPGELNHLHLTSTRFDEPRGVALVQRADLAVSIHICSGDKKLVFVGGRHHELKTAAIKALRATGLDAVLDRTDHAGLDPRNITNRGRLGRGLQFEVSESLRDEMFRIDPAGNIRGTQPSFDRFVEAVRELLEWYLSARPPQ